MTSVVDFGGSPRSENQRTPRLANPKSKIENQKSSHDRLELADQATDRFGGVHVEEGFAACAPAAVLEVEHGGCFAQSADVRDLFHVAPSDRFVADVDADKRGQQAGVAGPREPDFTLPVAVEPFQTARLAGRFRQVEELGFQLFALQTELPQGSVGLSAAACRQPRTAQPTEGPGSDPGTGHSNQQHPSDQLQRHASSLQGLDAILRAPQSASSRDRHSLDSFSRLDWPAPTTSDSVQNTLLRNFEV